MRVQVLPWYSSLSTLSIVLSASRLPFCFSFMCCFVDPNQLQGEAKTSTQDRIGVTERHQGEHHSQGELCSKDSVSPIRDPAGTIVFSQDAILQVWHDHFKSTFAARQEDSCAYDATPAVVDARLASLDALMSCLEVSATLQSMSASRALSEWCSCSRFQGLIFAVLGYFPFLCFCATLFKLLECFVVFAIIRNALRALLSFRSQRKCSLN